MMTMTARTRDNTKKVQTAVKKKSFRNLGHAGAIIRWTAYRSIRRDDAPSLPGQPPHTRKGQLQHAILYGVEEQRGIVVIGPSHLFVGRSGAAHEHGGQYMRQRYPRRPFMGPALEKNKERLPKLWAGSVKA